MFVPRSLGWYFCSLSVDVDSVVRFGNRVEVWIVIDDWIVRGSRVLILDLESRRLGDMGGWLYGSHSGDDLESDGVDEPSCNIYHLPVSHYVVLWA